MKFVGPGVDIELVGTGGPREGLVRKSCWSSGGSWRSGWVRRWAKARRRGEGKGRGKKTVHEEKGGWRRGSIRKEKKMEERERGNGKKEEIVSD